MGASGCHVFEARSYLCLTDSGGIQEECPSYGVPVLVMRDTTERPEGVDAGTLKLVGTSEEVIYSTFKMLLENDVSVRVSQPQRVQLKQPFVAHQENQNKEVITF